MPSYAIIGASRGIGLEYVRQLAARPNTTVFAVVRNPATSTFLHSTVEGLKNVHVVAGDVADYASLQRAAQQISAVTGGTLDSLIHVAARMEEATMWHGFDDFPSMEALDEDLIDAFKINALGIVHAISALLPLLRASTANLKKIVVVGTRGADPVFIRNVNVAAMSAYGITKAAALVAATKWAVKLKDEGFVVVTVCPGYVNTADTKADPAEAEKLKNVLLEMQKTSPSEIQTPEQSVSRLLKIMDELKPSDNGLALSYDGRWST